MSRLKCMPVRVLVVDDFAPWRSSVCSLLRGHTEFRLVGEAADGVEAVEQARKLQPDLILLDIGLPRLNGIEAAKQICQVAPGTKILFLTLNSEADVVQAALDTGGQGYVLKADSELWPAIKAVLKGEQYFSNGCLDSMAKTPPYNLLEDVVS